jgi:hypothetical protein
MTYHLKRATVGRAQATPATMAASKADLSFRWGTILAGASSDNFRARNKGEL